MTSSLPRRGASRHLKRQAGTEKRRRAAHANRSCRGMSRHSPRKQELQRHFLAPCTFHFSSLSGSWGTLGRSWEGLWEGSGRSWRVLWALGFSWAALVAMLVGSWGQLGPSWSQDGRVLGPTWGVLEPSWEHLGAKLGSSWSSWDEFGALGRRSRAIYQFSQKPSKT